MSDQKDDDRPRSGRPAVPPFRGPRTESTPARPAEKGQGTATSSAAPRPFIPGAPASAGEGPLTPPPTLPEPTLELETMFDSSRPGSNPPLATGVQSAAADPPTIAEPLDDDMESLAPATRTVQSSARDHAESHRVSNGAVASDVDTPRLAHATPENGTGEDHRLPALRFTGGSAFAAIPGGSDAGDVDASVDDAFSALGAPVSHAPVERRGAEPVAEPPTVSPLEPVAASPEPSPPNVELPWLDTNSEPEPLPQHAAETSKAGNDPAEHVAQALESLAARVRRGELLLPTSVATSGEPAILAAVLAALLGGAG